MTGSVAKPKTVYDLYATRQARTVNDVSWWLILRNLFRRKFIV